MLSEETAKFILTVIATFATSLLTIGRWFYCSVDTLNKKINDLSLSITALDKNLAIQTAIFENYIKKGN